MKQQRILWNRLTEERALFRLEQGHCQKVLSSSVQRSRKQPVMVLLPQAAVEAKLVRLPLVSERQTRQMLAMAWKTAEGEQKAALHKWRLVRKAEGEQWLFTISYAQESLYRAEQEAEMQGLAIKEIVGVYDALLILWQQLESSADLKGEVILLYHSGEYMTLLFMQNGQPIHGQTMSRMQTAEEMAGAFKRTVNALMRQELWQQTERLFYLEEGQEAELWAKQLAVLTETEVQLLNSQQPFDPCEAAEEMLLVHAYLEAAEKHSTAKGWQQMVAASPDRWRRNSYRGAVAMVAIAGFCWLGSALWLEYTQKQAAEERSAIVQQAEQAQRAPDYGQLLTGIAAEKGRVQLQEIQFGDRGLLIYVEAPNWSDAAAFGERLQGLIGISSITITRSEKLLRLEESTPASFIAVTIAIALEGGVSDES